MAQVLLLTASAWTGVRSPTWDEVLQNFSREPSESQGP